MKRYLVAVAMVAALAAGAGLAADTNVLPFAYTTSLAADVSTPDTWTRKLNDGYWTNSALDGVKFMGDVTVTLDLGWRTQVSKVDLYTFSTNAPAVLATQSAVLEWSSDATNWYALGEMANPSNAVFTISPALLDSPRYLRLTCSKGIAAAGQSLAEIVVSGTPTVASALLDFTYTPSQPSHATHPDYAFTRLKDDQYLSANSDSVQYGPGSAIQDGNPTNAWATNVVISVTLDGVKKLRRAHLYAYHNGNGYVTESVVLSNSLDGVSWTCAGLQTNVFETLINGSSVTRRYDFILPNTEARYLAFACRKGTASNVYRQLLAEIQIYESMPALGDPLAFTYEANLAPANSLDKPECPKLTDGVWDSNTRNAIRYYGDVQITADLGAARYVAGADLLCWSNRFAQGSDSNYVYSTGRVVVNGSLDKTNWTQAAEITKWSPSFPYHHAVTFTNMPYARYLRFDTYRCTDTPSATNTAQIMGELTIYRPPARVIGALPVEVAGVLTNGGFETPAIPDGDAASMLIKGGSVDGWTFSSADSANYSGYQRNRSSVSTNYFTTRYFAPEGSQTAVLMGSGTMQTAFSLSAGGSFALQFRVNSTVFANNNESGGYDFRVLLDGVDKGVVTVLQLTNAMRQVLLADVAAGAHTLRFQGLNTKALTWGALIDDIRLKRYEVSDSQIAEQGKSYVMRASSSEPTALNYAGTLTVKELWLEGVQMPKGRYSAANTPTIFEGPGTIGHSRGTVLMLE